jgi:hypothetical protein
MVLLQAAFELLVRRQVAKLQAPGRENGRKNGGLLMASREISLCMIYMIYDMCV